MPLRRSRRMSKLAIVALLCVAMAAVAFGDGPVAEVLVPAPGKPCYRHAIVSISPCRPFSPGECTAFLASTVQEASEITRVQSVFPLFVDGGCLLHLRGWPESVSGVVDLVVKIGGEGLPLSIRLPGALTITRPTIAVALVVDDSRSMRKTDPNRLRVEAVRVFAGIGAVRDDLRSISVIAFSRRARLVLPPTSPRETEALEEALGSLAASGSTDMDGALYLAARTLEKTEADRKVVVVLSDGKDEPGKYYGTHRLFIERGWPVYTIGLSELADLDVLRGIAAGTGGQFFFARDAAELSTIFRDIVLSLHHTVHVAQWDIESMSERAVPIDDTVNVLSFILDEGRGPSVRIMSPDPRFEQRLGPGPGDRFIDFHVPERGEWLLRDAGNGAGTVAVTASSNLELIPFPNAERCDAAAPLKLAAVLVRGDGVVTGAVCSVVLEGSDGIRHEGVLADDGEHGDGLRNDGIYGGAITPPSSGQCIGHLVARGMTGAGFAFERTSPFMVQVTGTPLPPVVAAEPSPPPVQAAPEVSTPVVPETVPPVAVPEEVTIALAPVVTFEPPVAPFEGKSLPAPPDPVWPLALLGLLIFLLLLLLVLLVRLFIRANPMTRYMLASAAIHALVFFLIMDKLIETGAVELEKISPTLAVQVRSVKEALGFDSTPTGKPVDLPQSMSDADVGRKKQDKASNEIAVQPDEPDLHAKQHVQEPPETVPAPTMVEETDLALKEARQPEELAEQARIKEKVAASKEVRDRERAAEVAKRATVSPAETRPAVELSSSEQAARELTAPVPVTEIVPDELSVRAATAIKSSGNHQELEEAAEVVVHEAASSPQVDEPGGDVRVGKQSMALVESVARAVSQPSANVGSTGGALVTTLLPAETTSLVGSPSMREKQTPGSPAVALGDVGQAEMKLAISARRSIPPSAASLAAAVALPGVDGGETTGITAPVLETGDGRGLEPVALPGSPSVQAELSDIAAGGHSKASAGQVGSAEQVLPVPAKRSDGESIGDSQTGYSVERVETGTPGREVHEVARPGLPRQGGGTVRMVAASVQAPGQAMVTPLTSGQKAVADAMVAAELSDDAFGAPKPRAASGTDVDVGAAVVPVVLPAEMVEEGTGRATSRLQVGPGSVGKTAVALPASPGDPEVRADPLLPLGKVTGKSETIRDMGPKTVDTFGVRGVKRASGAAVSDNGASVQVSGQSVVSRDARARATGVRDMSIAAVLPTVEPELAPGLQGDAGSELSLSLGGPLTGSSSIVISLGRYSGGDWDCSPTAMMYLAHQIGERTGMALDASARTVALSSPELMKAPFVYITGHKDFKFSQAEIANLRRYLEAGGSLWADDSTHFGDEAFDDAFRRELGRLLPDNGLVRLPIEFPGFATGYDLSGGYEGYAIPPGDKYRLDYVEGVYLGERVAVIYTRNDYGDGLNIDPNTAPLKPSLTDLSPAEMQEGAVRMGVNMVLYFLSSRPGVESEFVRKAGSDLRKNEQSVGLQAPTGQSRKLDGFEVVDGWQSEEWGDPTELAARDGKLSVTFAHGDAKKSAFTRTWDEPWSLSSSDALVIGAENRLRCGARLALGLVIGDTYYETRPFYLKPGQNTAFFNLSEKSFKCQASDWEYNAPIDGNIQVGRITILVYSPMAGQVVLDELRAVRGE